MSTRKKVDNRIRVLIENGIALRHRTMFVIVGDKGKDQVVILHHMLSKAAVKARPSVLWCYKKELGFSTHRKKRMRQLQKKIKSGTLGLNHDDPFELFISSTQIRYTYYKETHKILGSTYGMCVLQDFEALTPNLLARTIETVEGGGIVAILLRTMTSLKQLYTMTMDVHARYRTEAHQDVIGRFNERFLLSLASCQSCLVIDDQLNVLPISTQTLSILPAKATASESESKSELTELQQSLADTQPVGVIVGCAHTSDQAKAVLKFIEAISEKTLRSTVALTAARGRGKSAALGLAIASAVAFGYSNIFVTSPSPENLKTLFEFVFKGFDALEYQEHLDYELIQSTNPEFNNAVVRVNIFREHRQTIQYIHPSDAMKLGQAELVVVDEAAAIPLPLVRSLLGPYLVFLSSTVNGYEGTGRSLSLKLISQLRQQSAKQVSASGQSSLRGVSGMTVAAGRMLYEVTLDEPIRYASDDNVEKWLHQLLCLDVSNIPRIVVGCPLPKDCLLYYVNRDTLFSYNKASEVFLQRLMSLYVASHYKNTPNDLQLLSDAPAHHLFCLLGPVDPEANSLPDVLCVLQVCLEGEIAKSSIMKSLSRGQRPSGDLIPWTISQQFQDSQFGQLSGVRIVRIATHPDLQGMGYGSCALELLKQYYKGEVPSLSEVSSGASTELLSSSAHIDSGSLIKEQLKPRTNLPPLLLKLSERPAERLDYVGVAYGLTRDLLRFWKRAGMSVVYLRQTPNELTGEHTCIMLHTLTDSSDSDQESVRWLPAFCSDFRRRFVSLLSYQFRSLQSSLALSILQDRDKQEQQVLAADELQYWLTDYDLNRLELYSKNLVDHHLITDLLPTVAQLHFLKKSKLSLSVVQSAMLIGLGLQRKTVEDLEKELGLPAQQLLGLFNRIIRKAVKVFTEIQTTRAENELGLRKEVGGVEMQPLEKSIDDELASSGIELKAKHKKQLEELSNSDLHKYVVAGTEDEWHDALSKSSPPAVVSIKRREKRRKESSFNEDDRRPKKAKKHKSKTIRK
ncbi:RNA cytidine acetyltransferase-like [Corticium candelabrum]|uniref:RNA cytidine acetyltransferase-like n=1 Tax=Corticium candelabrum TaxID=121492 RepID=UPI002E26080B|nr:RNA cytidine acetyltransferase-like [Corticium candelabrum]